MAIELLDDRWANASAEDQKEFAQEGLILQVTEAIWAQLEARGWTKSDLARALGTSKSNVTQLLNGNRNLTLRTLSDICFALKAAIRVQIGEVNSIRMAIDDSENVFVAGTENIVALQSGKSAFRYDQSDNDESWKIEIRRKAA